MYIQFEINPYDKLLLVVLNLLKKKGDFNFQHVLYTTSDLILPYVQE